MITCDPDGSIVHIIAPFGRDAESIAGIVGQRGLTRRVYGSLAALASDLLDASGVVVLTEEAVGGDLQQLSRILQSQAAWSDIPFVLLRAPRGTHNGRQATLPAEVTNVIELERPLRTVFLAERDFHCLALATEAVRDPRPDGAVGRKQNGLDVERGRACAASPMRCRC